MRFDRGKRGYGLPWVLCWLVLAAQAPAQRTSPTTPPAPTPPAPNSAADVPPVASAQCLITQNQFVTSLGWSVPKNSSGSTVPSYEALTAQLATVLSACSGSAVKPLRAMNVLSPVEITQIMTLATPIVRELTGFQLNMTYRPSTQVGELLQSQLDNRLNEFDGWLHETGSVVDMAESPGGWGFVDLGPYIASDVGNLNMSDVHPFYRNVVFSYGAGMKISLPGGSNLPYLLYRKDIFQRYNLSVPVTWDEYAALALRMNGTDFDGDKVPDYSLCFHTVPGYLNAFNLLMVLASHVQTQGYQQGMLWDAETMTPMINNPAMQYALDLWRTLSSVTEPLSNKDQMPVFSKCLMNVGALSMFKMSGLLWPRIAGSIGAAIVPGATKVLDRSTMQLVPCRSGLCSDTVVDASGNTISINRAPFFGPPSVGLTINPHTDAGYLGATWKVMATVMDPGFLGKMVVMNPLSPYSPMRYFEMDPSPAGLKQWTNTGRYNINATREVLLVSRATLDHPNIVPDIRIRHMEQYYQVLDSEVTSLLVGNQTSRAAMNNMDTRFAAIMTAGGGPEAAAVGYRTALQYRFPSPPPAPSPPHAPVYPPVPGLSPLGAAPSSPDSSQQQLLTIVATVTVVGSVLLVCLVFLGWWAFHRRQEGRRSLIGGMVVPPRLGRHATLLSTDIEGSTRLFETVPEAMDAALAIHNQLIQRVLDKHSGYASASEGDGWVAAFHTPDDALRAAAELQQLLLEADWPEDLLATEQCAPVFLTAAYPGPVSPSAWVHLAAGVGVGGGAWRGVHNILAQAGKGTSKVPHAAVSLGRDADLSGRLPLMQRLLSASGPVMMPRMLTTMRNIAEPGPEAHGPGSHGGGQDYSTQQQPVMQLGGFAANVGNVAAGMNSTLQSWCRAAFSQLRGNHYAPRPAQPRLAAPQLSSDPGATGDSLVNRLDNTWSAPHLQQSSSLLQLRSSASNVIILPENSPVSNHQPFPNRQPFRHSMSDRASPPTHHLRAPPTQPPQTFLPSAFDRTNFHHSTLDGTGTGETLTSDVIDTDTAFNNAGRRVPSRLNFVKHDSVGHLDLEGRKSGTSTVESSQRPQAALRSRLVRALSRLFNLLTPRSKAVQGDGQYSVSERVSGGASQHTRLLVYRGLRVRMGAHSGLHDTRQTHMNASTGRVQYGGDFLGITRAVCDAACGGMVLISQETFQQVSWQGLSSQLAVLAAGEHLLPCQGDVKPLPRAQLYEVFPHSTAWRMVTSGPIRSLRVTQPGYHIAPCGRVAVAYLQAVGVSSLMVWNPEVTRDSLSLMSEIATALLVPFNGYLLDCSEALGVLAAFSSAADAIKWALVAEQALMHTDWPEELLEHPLGEELCVSAPVPSPAQPAAQPTPRQSHAQWMPRSSRSSRPSHMQVFPSRTSSRDHRRRRQHSIGPRHQRPSSGATDNTTIMISGGGGARSVTFGARGPLERSMSLGTQQETARQLLVVSEGDVGHVTVRGMWSVTSDAGPGGQAGASLCSTAADGDMRGQDGEAEGGTAPVSMDASAAQQSAPVSAGVLPVSLGGLGLALPDVAQGGSGRVLPGVAPGGTQPTPSQQLVQDLLAEHEATLEAHQAQQAQQAQRTHQPGSNAASPQQQGVGSSASPQWPQQQQQQQQRAGTSMSSPQQQQLLPLPSLQFRSLEDRWSVNDPPTTQPQATASTGLAGWVERRINRTPPGPENVSRSTRFASSNQQWATTTAPIILPAAPRSPGDLGVRSASLSGQRMTPAQAPVAAVIPTRTSAVLTLTARPSTPKLLAWPLSASSPSFSSQQPFPRSAPLTSHHQHAVLTPPLSSASHISHNHTLGPPQLSHTSHHTVTRHSFAPSSANRPTHPSVHAPDATRSNSKSSMTDLLPPSPPDRTVLLRGLRIRCGIDVGNVRLGINDISGRITMVGKVMNRAARVTGVVRSGQVWCTAEAWDSAHSDTPPPPSPLALLPSTTTTTAHLQPLALHPPAPAAYVFSAVSPPPTTSNRSPWTLPSLTEGIQSALQGGPSGGLFKGTSKVAPVTLDTPGHSSAPRALQQQQQQQQPSERLPATHEPSDTTLEIRPAQPLDVPARPLDVGSRPLDDPARTLDNIQLQVRPRTPPSIPTGQSDPQLLQPPPTAQPNHLQPRPSALPTYLHSITIDIQTPDGSPHHAQPRSKVAHPPPSRMPNQATLSPPKPFHTLDTPSQFLDTIPSTGGSVDAMLRLTTTTTAPTASHLAPAPNHHLTRPSPQQQNPMVVVDNPAYARTEAPPPSPVLQHQQHQAQQQPLQQQQQRLRAAQVLCAEEQRPSAGRPVGAGGQQQQQSSGQHPSMAGGEGDSEAVMHALRWCDQTQGHELVGTSLGPFILKSIVEHITLVKCDLESIDV